MLTEYEDVPLGASRSRHRELNGALLSGLGGGPGLALSLSLVGGYLRSFLDNSRGIWPESGSPGLNKREREKERERERERERES